jgi:TPP-dependent trihydroxycyclohexane-1,2-dione (THcHDO) dehydratase
VILPFLTAQKYFEAQIDSLQDIINATIQDYDSALNQLADGADTTVDFCRQPQTYGSVEWEDHEIDSLRSYIALILREQDTSTSVLSPDQKDHLVDDIIAHWTNVPFEYRSTSGKTGKQDPNRLIQSEMEHILK